MLAPAVIKMQVVMRGIREEEGNAVTSVVTNRQWCINGIVIAGLHNDFQVMLVTVLLEPHMNFQFIC
jgi:hypothetical protein